ncbi:hypothetical protein N7457_001543 [Penicillium paradoxum]|uniref:uncharacterized protein n=1 Tax=Penicillium paradoxum TaxID=176176 RepID=UPI002546C35C|nr:uncharacterized protein N7457_001543 [Penicillium paradoxum]KAJ5794944.1 hypothetical protein N7457_001543 [Penicillium paradoxum]
MEPKLPQGGLVAMSTVSLSDTLRQDTLSTGAYKNLWQAYSTSHLASKDETERRLEHLFWRIWSAQRLSSRLNVRTLDHLILRIKAPAVLVGQEVTVRQAMPETGNKEEQVTANLFHIKPLQYHINHSYKPINKTQSGCVAGTCSLHPILKKPQPAPVESHKTTRLLLDTSSGTKITLEPSFSPTATMTAEPESISDVIEHQSPKKTNIPAGPTAIPDPVNRQSSKKTFLTATRPGRGPRRRPVFNRRKSSQTSVPKATPPRRRSEPTTKKDGSNDVYEDSYVELGLLQHLSLRDEEDQIARDLGREIAPEPKPKPAVPLFDDDFIDEPTALQTAKARPKASPVPFPRASSLRRPMLSPEDFCKITPSFGVLQSHVDTPGGPQLMTEDLEGDWTDVDAIDSTLPISQPFKNLVVHQAVGKAPAVKKTSLLSSGMKGVKGVKS